jgi:hypothetical protein
LRRRRKHLREQSGNPLKSLNAKSSGFATSLIFKDLIAILFRRLFPLLAERRKKGDRQLNLSDTAPTIADISGKRNSFHTPVDVAGWNGGCENRP